jgi:hypothetical protein
MALAFSVRAEGERQKARPRRSMRMRDFFAVLAALLVCGSIVYLLLAMQ